MKGVDLPWAQVANLRYREMTAERYDLLDGKRRRSPGCQLECPVSGYGAGADFQSDA